MPCYAPLRGYRSVKPGPDGKRTVTLDKSKGFFDRPIDIPCGGCDGCRLERSRQWAIRCMHEASLHEDNAFITLTYDDEHLPPLGSLRPRDLQLFFKRLRKRLNGKRISYFAAGEYGARFGRPHYHCCLFGHDFPDKSYVRHRSDNPVWVSDELAGVWRQGSHEIGSVTYSSAAYVARYILEKRDASSLKYHVVDADTGETGEVVREFVRMSRRPAIGKGWFEKFGAETYPSDGVVVNGGLQKPPRYYDQQLKAVDPALFEQVAEQRRRVVFRSRRTPERLEAHEKIAASKRSTFERGDP